MTVFKSKERPSEIIRTLFKDKNVGDEFELVFPGCYSITQMRANIKIALKKTPTKYRTKTVDNKLFILITEV